MKLSMGVLTITTIIMMMIMCTSVHSLDIRAPDEDDFEKGKFMVRLNLKKENIFIQFVLTEIRIKNKKEQSFKTQ